ncbi:MAG: hypothetical protein ACXW5U_15395 [Thermoanaerobaculia bacterium]
MSANFYCHVCRREYNLRFLTADEVSQRQRFNIATYPLTCPIGHTNLTML